MLHIPVILMEQILSGQEAKHSVLQASFVAKHEVRLCSHMDSSKRRQVGYS